MRAIDIYSAFEYYKKYIDSILASGDYNPILLNDYYITIELDPKEDTIDMMSILTRKVVLDRNNHKILKDTPTEFNITILEAIDFIQTITPPILKASVNRELKSIDHIIEYLKVYLLEDPDTEYKFYILRNNTHLQNDFKTGWEPSEKIKSKADFMKKNLPNKSSFFILEYLDGDVSTIIEALGSGYSYDKSGLSIAMQGVLVFPSIGGKVNEYAIQNFLDMNIKDIRYVDVYKDETNTVYLQLMSYSASDAFFYIMATTYRNFIK
jgi:hypothetical protein